MHDIDIDAGGIVVGLEAVRVVHLICSAPP